MRKDVTMWENGQIEHFLKCKYRNYEKNFQLKKEKKCNVLKKTAIIRNWHGDNAWE